MIRAVLITRESRTRTVFRQGRRVAGHLQEGWQQQVWDKFHGVYSPPALLFYINHLDWEIAKSTQVFQPAA
jgi:hypothetical protein